MLEHGLRVASEVEAAADRLNELVQLIEEVSAPLAPGEAAEMLRCVDTLHRAGLQQLAEVLREHGLEARARAIPEVELLLELYELVTAERTPAWAASELPVVPSPPEAAPAPRANVIPLSQIQVRRHRELRWYAVLDGAELVDGSPRAVMLDDQPVLLVRVDGEVLAYRDACPGSPLPLREGQVEGETLRCPWHGCRFALRGGQRVDAAGPGLGLIPVRDQGGQILLGRLEER